MTENVVVIKRAQREIRIPTLCNISASGQTLEKSTCRDRRKTRASYFDSIKSRVSETTALFFPFKTPTVTKKTKEEQKRYSLRGRKLQVMVFRAKGEGWERKGANEQRYFFDILPGPKC